MRNIIIIIAASLLFILLFPDNAQAQNTPSPLTLPNADFSSMRKTGQGMVMEVVNPMTVKLKDGRSVSLAGMDFPDLDYYDPGKLAVTAQKILKDFLTGKTVNIYQTKNASSGRVNRMGHHIAHLTRNEKQGSLNKDTPEIWVQGLLLSLGLSRTRTTKYNREMASQMLTLEKQARDNRQGLWNIEKYSPLTPEQAANHIGSFQIIEGTVHNVSSHKNNLYINFSGNWRTDFTIGIGAQALRKFNREHIYPRRWNGKTLRVHGWVESYNGPFIEIDHPERIELIQPPHILNKIP